MKFDWFKKKAPFSIRFMDLQMTYLCNADCFFCIAHNNIPTMIDLMAFKSLAHNGHIETVEELVLTGGEPTIVRDFEKILYYAYEKFPKMKIRVITNAIYMPEKIMNALLLDNVASIHISINSSNSMTYKEIMKCDKFNAVVSNINRFIRKRRTSNPVVLGSLVLVKENLNDILPLIYLGKELKLDSLTFLEAGLDSNHSDSIPNQEVLKSILMEAKDLAKQQGIPLAISEGLGQHEKCTEPWEKVFVAYDGAVNPCCGYDFTVSRDEHLRGNLLKEDLNDFWYSGLYAYLRNGLETNNPLPACRACYKQKLTN